MNRIEPNPNRHFPIRFDLWSVSCSSNDIWLESNETFSLLTDSILEAIGRKKCTKYLQWRWRLAQQNCPKIELKKKGKAMVTFLFLFLFWLIFIRCLISSQRSDVRDCVWKKENWKKVLQGWLIEILALELGDFFHGDILDYDSTRCVIEQPLWLELCRQWVDVSSVFNWK